jgi:hypothetical protein
MTMLDIESHGEIAAPSFDYSSLKAHDLEAVRRAEVAIRQHARKQVAEVIAIGRELIRVKGILEHGQFGKWIVASFPFSARTATRYMRLAEVYGDKSEMLSDLQRPPGNALSYRVKPKSPTPTSNS